MLVHATSLIGGWAGGRALGWLGGWCTCPWRSGTAEAFAGVAGLLPCPLPARTMPKHLHTLSMPAACRLHLQGAQRVGPLQRLLRRGSAAAHRHLFHRRRPAPRPAPRPTGAALLHRAVHLSGVDGQPVVPLLPRGHQPRRQLCVRRGRAPRGPQLPPAPPGQQGAVQSHPTRHPHPRLRLGPAGRRWGLL